MSDDFATVSGSATLGGIVMTGGRLVGLAGSSIAAPAIAVGQGAIFGSAGTVNGNIAAEHGRKITPRTAHSRHPQHHFQEKPIVPPPRPGSLDLPRQCGSIFLHW